MGVSVMKCSCVRVVFFAAGLLRCCRFARGAEFGCKRSDSGRFRLLDAEIASFVMVVSRGGEDDGEVSDEFNDVDAERAPRDPYVRLI